MATPRIAFDWISGAWPLYAATARSSNATAVFRNGVCDSVTPRKLKEGRFTAALPRALRNAFTWARSTAPTRRAASFALPRAWWLARHPKWLMLPLSEGECVRLPDLRLGCVRGSGGKDGLQLVHLIVLACGALLAAPASALSAGDVLRRLRRSTGPRSSGPSTRSTPRVRMSELKRSTRRGPSIRSTPRARMSKLERHAHRAQTQAPGRGHAPARVRSHGRFWERSLLSPSPRQFRSGACHDVVQLLCHRP